jgi:hypothetical protein
VTFAGILMLTPFCENDPKWVIGVAKVTVVFFGRMAAKLSAVQSRLARTVKEWNEKRKKSREKVERIVVEDYARQLIPNAK